MPTPGQLAAWLSQYRESMPITLPYYLSTITRLGCRTG